VAADGAQAGWCGFYDVVDDDRAAAALVAAAAAWLAERGCTSMTGPASFTVDADAGVQVAGFAAAGTTGRAWHPPHYADGLEAAGLREAPGSSRRTWRLPAEGTPTLAASDLVPAPPLVGPYADRRLLLGAPGAAIAAVPDLSVARGSAWQLARRAKRGEWEGCTVVECDGDPAQLVPALQAAAGAAGYQWVVAPWSPDPAAEPETEHVLFTREL
jgi:hypothetical protein